MQWFLKVSTLVLLFPQPEAAASWKALDKNQITTKFGVMTPVLELEVKNHDKNKTIHYKPNSPSKTIVGVAYRNLGVSYGFTNPVTERAELEKGDTQSTDLGLRLYGKLTFDLVYQRYKSYYIDNSKQIDPSYGSTGNRIIRPDLESQNIGASLFYNLREDDFSLGVALDHAGHADKSAWSPFLTLAYSNLTWSADTPLVPALVSAQFGSLADLTRFRVDAVALGGALGGIWTGASGFYATGFLSLGLGYQKQLATTTVGSDKSDKAGVASAARMGLGYNGDSNYLALQLYADSLNSSVLSGELNTSRVDAGLIYGHRW